MVWEGVGKGTQHSALSTQHLQKQTRQAVKALHRFNIGKPAGWMCQGWVEQLQGRPGKAVKLWQKGLDAAALLQTPYEEGWLHYQLGRHLPPTDPARQHHLQQAQDIFTRLKNGYELSLVQELRKAPM